MKSFFGFVCLVLLLVSVVGQTPIPTRPDGYASGPANAPVVLEAFFDLLCPDSAASWPTIQQVMANYNGQLYFIFHTFPLPYHTFSFIANQGMHVLAHATNNSIPSLFSYATFFFKNQGIWYNTPTMNMSTTEVITSMAAAVGSQGLLPPIAFITGIADTTINYETRVSWKYACSRGQVTGTPTFLVNGVFVNADPSWTLADWKMIIDPLIQANNPMAIPATTRPLAPIKNRHVKTSSPSNPFKFRIPSRQNISCPSGEDFCQYAPDKSECCLAGENCIPNVGCRCMTDSCRLSSNSGCPSGETLCQYAPDKSECCLAGENCIPNVGCRCMTDSC